MEKVNEYDQSADNKQIIYPLSNDIIFGLVMQDVEICRELIERILPNRKVRKLKLCEGSNMQLQKTIITGIIEKGVRLDVLFENDNIWYDIEMQNGQDKHLPKRGRYYASAMDIDEADKGIPYSQLKTSYIIFICPFDIYKQGHAVYEFQNYDVKNNLPYGDDSYKIIVNTACPEKNTPPELRTFFSYINNMQIPSNDEFITKVHSKVKNYNTPEWRRQIMTLEEKIKEESRIAREEVLAGLIEICQELGLSREETIGRVENKLSLSKTEVESYISKYWKL